MQKMQEDNRTGRDANRQYHHDETSLARTTRETAEKEREDRRSWEQFSKFAPTSFQIACDPLEPEDILEMVRDQAGPLITVMVRKMEIFKAQTKANHAMSDAQSEASRTMFRVQAKALREEYKTNIKAQAEEYQLKERKRNWDLFTKLAPKPFTIAHYPLAARDWKNKLEKLFEILDTTEEEKLNFATSLLQAPAKNWCDSEGSKKKDSHHLCEGFKELFLKHDSLICKEIQMVVELPEIFQEKKRQREDIRMCDRCGK